MHAFKKGYITVFTGCMFSGKTEAMIAELRRHRLTHGVVLFKSTVDDRFGGKDEIESHNHSSFPSIQLASVMEIDSWLEDNEVGVVGVDEFQFFQTSDALSLVGLADKWANRGKIFVATALDQDFRGEPFPGIPELLIAAEEVHKLHAVCIRCGGLASRSRRKGVERDSKKQILVGGADAYEALCRDCSNEASV